MKPSALLAFGIAWSGYLLMWYGWTQLHGGQAGIIDLALPSRSATLAGKLASQTAGVTKGGSPATPGGFVMTPQAGSPGVPNPSPSRRGA